MPPPPRPHGCQLHHTGSAWQLTSEASAAGSRPACAIRTLSALGCVRCGTQAARGRPPGNNNSWHRGTGGWHWPGAALLHVPRHAAGTQRCQPPQQRQPSVVPTVPACADGESPSCMAWLFALSDAMARDQPLGLLPASSSCTNAWWRRCAGSAPSPSSPSSSTSCAGVGVGVGVLCACAPCGCQGTCAPRSVHTRAPPDSTHRPAIHLAHANYAHAPCWAACSGRCSLSSASCSPPRCTLARPRCSAAPGWVCPLPRPSL